MIKKHSVNSYDPSSLGSLKSYTFCATKTKAYYEYKNVDGFSPPRTVWVEKHSDDPTTAWDEMKVSANIKNVRQMKLDTPVRKDAVRFVCISDTHSKVTDPSFIPKGDILLVAGSFTTCGSPDEIQAFSRFLEKLPHRYKVVIAGDSEMTFDPDFGTIKYDKNLKTPNEIALRKIVEQSLKREESPEARHLLQNCFYLEDDLIKLYGLSIYGTPWIPLYDNWAFNLPRGKQLLEKWDRIPCGVDVLLTHTPPLGHGDLLKTGARVGCVELYNSVSKRVRPKYHVFGFVPEGYGCTTDGYTKFINASICESKAKTKLPTGTVNQPIIFDIPLPEGIGKNCGTQSIHTLSCYKTYVNI